ncbi:MAG: YncE family protein [Terriglobales bacterium]
MSAQRKPLFTSPLPTGVRLDPVGEAVDLGRLPINLVLTPEKDRAVVVLSGWREQGVQVVDLKTRQVTQTLLQDGAFYGAAFSPDGRHLCVSGGNTDLIFVYAWKDGAATLDLPPYDPIIPTQDLNEKNPQNTAAARLSESLDLSAPDRVDDQPYNRILWLMMKGDVPPPVAQSHAALHVPQSSK